MVLAIPLIFLLIFWGLAIVCGKLPAVAQVILVIVFSFALAWLHWSTAQHQLDTVGFAARNRDPNHLAQDIGYALALAGLLNCIVVFKNVRVATITLGSLVTLLPIFFFISI